MAVETRTSPASHTVRVHESIADVRPGEWNALLSAEDLQASHAFIQACEESGVENAVYRHVLIERSGKLVAVASLSCMRVSLDLLSSGPTRDAIRWARNWRPSFLRLPIVLCGLPVSFGSSCVRIRSGEDPAPVVDVLASCAESFAREVGARLVCFKEFAPTESVDFDRLQQHCYFRAESLPFCTLPVAWRSFDEYLSSLRAGYRRQVLGSLRSGYAAGLTLRTVEDFGHECERIFGLYEQVMDRAEYQLERLNLAFFERLNTRLGPQSFALLVERDSQLVAAAVLLAGPHTLTFLLAGIDYERNRDCHAYPFLMTQLVAEAIKRGARSLELGQTSYALKGRFGAHTQPRCFYLKHRTGVRNALLRVASGALFPAAKPPPRRVFKGAPVLPRSVEGR